MLHARVIARAVLTARALAHHEERDGRATVRAEPVASALARRPELDALLVDAALGEPRLATIKDAIWLDWRYAQAPVDYRALALESDGELDGLAIYRSRLRRGLPEAVVEELFVRPDDRRSARRLLGAVIRSTHLPLVSCEFPADSAAATAATQLGFVPWRGGMRLMVSTVDHDLTPAPEHIDSWALSLGDLELV
jgi:hypothetical protein